MYALYLRFKNEEDNIGSRRVKSNKNASTAAFSVVCTGCGRRDKVRLLYMKQLRSADEGMTSMYGCDACGHKFRHS